MNSEGARRLLTFRLDQERRQRLRARLAREGRTMSEVVTNGLRQYVAGTRHRDGAGGPGRLGAPALPERVAARLRELRSSGRSELLSGTLAALNDAGWPLRSLAEALGISRQAVQARVRRALAGLRPHLTIKIDQTLRVSAHRAAADEGSSLTQVVEAILDRYLRQGMADGDQAPPEDYSRRRTRIIRHASAASTGRSPSKSP